MSCNFSISEFEANFGFVSADFGDDLSGRYGDEEEEIGAEEEGVLHLRRLPQIQVGFYCCGDMKVDLLQITIG